MTFEQYLSEQFWKQYNGLDDEAPEAEQDWLAGLEIDDWLDHATDWHSSLSLCYDCVKANISCQIYPQKTKHCVEYTKK